MINSMLIIEQRRDILLRYNFFVKLFHECLVSSPVSFNNFFFNSFILNITTINNPYLNIIIIIY